MFKYWAIKKYGTKLLPKLRKRYGEQRCYTASQLRATVYQCDFNPQYLPLGYILFLNENELERVLKQEFPEISVPCYKKELTDFLNGYKYQGYLQVLSH